MSGTTGGTSSCRTVCVLDAACRGVPGCACESVSASASVAPSVLTDFPVPAALVVVSSFSCATWVCDCSSTPLASGALPEAGWPASWCGSLTRRPPLTRPVLYRSRATVVPTTRSFDTSATAAGRSDACVRVQAGGDQVDEEEVEHDTGESRGVDPRCGLAPPSGRRPGVQVGRVDDPRDERHGLLGVPVPEPAPGRLGPDRATEHAERVDRERQHAGAVGDPVQHLLGGQPLGEAGEPLRVALVGEPR